MPNTCKIEFINKKLFVQALLDENIKVFIVHIALFTLKITIYQTLKAQIILFIVKNVTVLAEYAHFANVFLKKLAKMFPK